MSSIQNLAPIMPFIEPIDPIELPSVFDLETANNPPGWKGKTSASNVSSPNKPLNDLTDTKHLRKPSEEEILLEKTRMELEQKIGELNQLKNQLAQTEQRERELASRITT